MYETVIKVDDMSEIKGCYDFSNLNHLNRLLWGSLLLTTDDLIYDHCMNTLITTNSQALIEDHCYSPLSTGNRSLPFTHWI